MMSPPFECTSPVSRITSFPVSTIGLVVPAPALASMRLVVPTFTVSRAKLAPAPLPAWMSIPPMLLIGWSRARSPPVRNVSGPIPLVFTAPSNGSLSSTVSAVDSSRTLPLGEHVTHGESLRARERDVPTAFGRKRAHPIAPARAHRDASAGAPKINRPAAPGDKIAAQVHVSSGTRVDRARREAVPCARRKLEPLACGERRGPRGGQPLGLNRPRGSDRQ